MYRRMLCGPSEASQALENASSDVRSRWIDHRVVIGKRNIADEAAVVVAIKCSSAAITILHAQQPLNAAANCAFHPLFIGKLHALQRHQHKRGVVHVGLMVIAKLKCPASG